MNLDENLIEMPVPQPDWFPRDTRFRISEPLLIEFMTTSKRLE